MTLTEGLQLGAGDDVGDQVCGQLAQIADRTGELVPAYGFQQAERELASAAISGPVAISR